jgi:hypothetical protein
MLDAGAVMARFGYKDRKSFWEFVHAKGVPFVRFNARVIKFETGPLEDWVESRRSKPLSGRTKLGLRSR